MSDSPMLDLLAQVIRDPEFAVCEITTLERELSAAKQRIAELERGEYICQKCGLRKEAEFERGDF